MNTETPKKPNIERARFYLDVLNDAEGDVRNEIVLAYTAIAQANATLFLAEQQRIANLIAFINSANEASARGTGMDEVGRARVLRAVDQVQEGLGL